MPVNRNLNLHALSLDTVSARVVAEADNYDLESLVSGHSAFPEDVSEKTNLEADFNSDETINVVEDEKSDSVQEMGKPMLAEGSPKSNGHAASNGANGHTNGHSNGAGNGKTAKGKPAVATAAEDTGSFFSNLIGRRKSSSPTPAPAKQPEPATPPKQSIKTRRYSGIIHANGAHRECFSDDDVTMIVESVTEKVTGIPTGDYSPPLSPGAATVDSEAKPGPVFKFPISKKPPPAPASHLSFFNQRMDRPLAALAIYSGLHFFASRVLMPKLPASELLSKDRVYLPEKLPSTVNAIATGSLALYSVWKRGIFWGEGVDKLNAWSEEVDLCFAGHLGFTVYDTYSEFRVVVVRCLSS
jgi:hypothetical protein